MNYIGSKYKLSEFISSTIGKVVGEELSGKVFCDIFAGTGIVGRTFKSRVKKVISNDCEYYSYVLNRNYIGNHTEIDDKHEYIDELNALPLIGDGFMYKNYCLGGGTGRQYFSDDNGKKIDTVRKTIERWRSEGRISSNLYFFLLASLLESADKVANTASVYGAYLKSLKPSAQKGLVLQPAIFDLNDNEHDVFNAASNDLISRIEGDILYLDPPYNERQYGANYHILNTIAMYDDFVPMGKTGMREYKRSNYCSAAKVVDEFEDLIRQARFRYVFLSYNNEGLMSVSTIRSIMERYGHYDLVQTDYPRFRADKVNARNHKADRTREYLHILEKKL